MIEIRDGADTSPEMKRYSLPDAASGHGKPDNVLRWRLTDAGHARPQPVRGVERRQNLYQELPRPRLKMTKITMGTLHQSLLVGHIAAMRPMLM